MHYKIKTPIYGLLFSLVFCLGYASAQETVEVESPQKKDAQPASSKLAWPQWRGPTRDGKVPAGTPAWPEKIDESNLKEIWRKELQPSYSGPILSKDLVFTTETRNKKMESVTAFDRKTGDKKWDTVWIGSIQVPFFAKANGDWIRSTPAFDGESLYVAGMRDVLVCINAEDGEEKWRVDFVNELGTKVPDFGFVCSPMLSGEFVYVQAGASFVKLSKSDGKIVWRTLQDRGGMMGSAFSSPVVTELGGKRQIVVQTREALAGVDDQSGDVLWTKNIEAYRGMNILTPTIYKNSVFTSAYGGNSQLFDVSMGSDNFSINENWNNPASGYMSSPVVIGDHIYMHLRNQRFTCIDMKTGESKWTTKPHGKYWSMVANGDRILALDERGDLLLIRANSEKFDVIETRKLGGGPSWGHLAVDGTELYVRELKSLVAYRWETAE